MRKLFLTALFVAMVNGSTVFAADNVRAANVGLKINTPENQMFVYQSNNDRFEGRMIIGDPLGFHARPLSRLAILAKSFRGTTIYIQKHDRIVRADKTMKLIAMGVKCGDEIKIITEGTEAEAAFYATLNHFIETMQGREV